MTHPQCFSAEHTPTPWEAQPFDAAEFGIGILGLRTNEGVPYSNPTNGLVCWASMLPTDIDANDTSRAEANAAFIVKAVNNHEALVKALTDAQRIIERDFPNGQLAIDIRAALANCDALATNEPQTIFMVKPVAWRVKNEFGHWYVTQDKALADTYRDVEKKDVQPLYLAAPPPAAPVEPAPLIELGDEVYINERSPYFHDWRGAKLKVVSLAIDPDGKQWASVIEGEQRHRGNGVYDAEITDIDADHLSTLSRPQQGTP